jgi:hypothetical protein
MNDIRPSINDRSAEEKIIIQQFMKELCRRDDEANRDMNPDPNIPHNKFSVRQIQEKVLNAYSLDKVVHVLKGYEMQDDPYIELLDPERSKKIRLTNAGRARCREFGL